MPRIKTNLQSSVTMILDKERYEQLKTLSAKTGLSMNQLGRNFIYKGLDGQVTEDNIEFLAPVIRNMIKSVLEPEMERLISLTAKTCIQAGTAAYLSADAILKFVPEEQRSEVVESYTAARKQAIEYTRQKSEN